MLDIDHFKAYNDACGHAEGDRALRMVADTMRGNLRQSSDVLAHYGGEEFAVVLPGIYGADAVALAERLRAAVEHLGLPHPIHRTVTVSVGVAVLQPCQARWTPLALIEAADHALYCAKQSGRNRVAQAHEPAARTEARRLLPEQR